VFVVAVKPQYVGTLFEFLFINFAAGKTFFKYM
jgi:hypothetical protein